MFKLGIDDFSYHRFYGMMILGQSDPGKRWTLDDFLDRAVELKVDSVSLETCFLPGLDRPFLESLRKKLDERGLDGMLSWGHPRGLEVGKNPGAIEDLKKGIEAANFLGTKVIRLVAGSFRDRDEARQPQIERLSEVLKDLVEMTAVYDVVLGMENHQDFMADEQLEIIERVGSDYLRVTLDTGNNVRLFEDPVEVARKLAPYTVATHIKDVAATGKGSPKNWRSFWPSVPLGRGIIDLPEIIRILRENDYRGSLNLEIDLLDEKWTDEDKAVAESIEYLRKIAS